MFPFLGSLAVPAKRLSTDSPQDALRDNTDHAGKLYGLFSCRPVGLPRLETPLLLSLAGLLAPRICPRLSTWLARGRGHELRRVAGPARSPGHRLTTFTLQQRQPLHSVLASGFSVNQPFRKGSRTEFDIAPTPDVRDAALFGP